MEYQCFSEMMEEMREIHKMIQKLTAQKCHHLTMEQLKLIFLIAHAQMNQKEIAQKLRITEATLSVRIKRLVDMGFIERKLNEDDKRHYYIVLSSQGEDRMVLSIVLSVVICPLFLLMDGDTAMIPVGTTKTVYTVSDIYITP